MSSGVYNLGNTCSIWMLGLNGTRGLKHKHSHLSYVDLVRCAKDMNLNDLNTILIVAEAGVKAFGDLEAQFQGERYDDSITLKAIREGRNEDQRIVDFIKTHLQQQAALRSRL